MDDVSLKITLIVPSNFVVDTFFEFLLSPSNVASSKAFLSSSSLTEVSSSTPSFQLISSFNQTEISTGRRLLDLILSAILGPGLGVAVAIFVILAVKVISPFTSLCILVEFGSIIQGFFSSNLYLEASVTRGLTLETSDNWTPTFGSTKYVNSNSGISCPPIWNFPIDESTLYFTLT